MRPRIAVVAVHGVADQAPQQSARDMAELLCRLAFGPPSTGACYHPFRVDGVAIPVQRLDPGEGQKLQDLVEYPGTGLVDLAFTRDALDRCEIRGDEAVYETVRLQSARCDAQGTPIADVHVFEMYWADLSRLSTGWLRIFGELYQLLLHVGSLAKHVATGVAARRRGRTARVFAASVQVAATMLEVPIAILNVALGVTAVLALADRATGYARPLAVALLTAGAMVVAGTMLSRLRRVSAVASFVVMGTLASGGIGAWRALQEQPPTVAVACFGIALVLVSCVALAAILRQYTQTRPGSAMFSFAVAPVVTALGVAFVWTTRMEPHPLVQAAFHLAEPLYLTLRASWIALIASAWTAFAAACLLLVQRRHDCPVRRAVWTALLSLSIPSLAFLVITCALWKALAMSIGSIGSGTYELLHVPVLGLATRETTLDGFIDLLLHESVGDGLPLILLLTAAAVVTALWALGPVVWAELFPPADNRRSEALGNWLTNGFRLLAFASGFLVAAFLFVLPLGAVVTDNAALPGLRGALQAMSAGLNVGLLFGLVGLPATSLLVFANRLQSLAAGFRTPLDIMLDVDNYLRMDPRTRTVRGRIFARYVSLLRLLRRRDALASRDVDAIDFSRGYDGIVIVAHSQGSVITADLFRFLTASGQLGGLQLPPVYLFTMGSPLRQLYGERFPDLYEWARHEDHGAWEVGRPLPDSQPPDPRALGVERWVNAYRSGDYVGRWLWRADGCADRFSSTERRSPWHAGTAITCARDAEGRRVEACIGAGAHTHYWDDTAPEIAALLDDLVLGAATGAFAAMTPFAES